MNFMLEALITTLLSLDYLLYLNHPPSTAVNVDVSPSLHNKPSSLQQCRAQRLSWSSLSSTESNESEFQSTSSGNAKEESLSEVMFFASRTRQTQAQGSSSQNQSGVTKTSTSASNVSNNNNNNNNNSQTSTARTYDYHCPPSSATNPDTYYQSNPTVFGQILRGDLPSRTLAESDRLVVLEDIHPKAPLHALVIPKAYIGSVMDLRQSDVEWLQESRDLALHLIQQHHPVAFASGDYRLVFHIPPFCSVQHVHLHVLAPLSQLSWYDRYIKYRPQTRWCIAMEQVMLRLQGDNRSGVPYLRPPMHSPQWQAM